MKEDCGWVPWSKYKLHWRGCCQQRLPLIDIAKSHWIWTGAWCYTRTKRDDWWLHTELERLFLFVTVCDASRFGSTSSDRAQLNTSMQEIGIGRRNKAGVFFGPGRVDRQTRSPWWGLSMYLFDLRWRFEMNSSTAYVIMIHFDVQGCTCKCTHDTSWRILYAQLRKYARFALHFKFGYLSEGLSFDLVLFNPNVWPRLFVLRDAQQFQLGFVLRRWSH